MERFRKGRTCERWVTHTHARLEKTTPSTSRHQGVISCDVRAGLRELKAKAVHLGPVNHLQHLLSEEVCGQLRRLSQVSHFFRIENIIYTDASDFHQMPLHISTFCLASNSAIAAAAANAPNQSDRANKP